MNEVALVALVDRITKTTSPDTRGMHLLAPGTATSRDAALANLELERRGYCFRVAIGTITFGQTTSAGSGASPRTSRLAT